MTYKIMNPYIRYMILQLLRFCQEAETAIKVTNFQFKTIIDARL